MSKLSKLLVTVGAIAGVVLVGDCAVPAARQRAGERPAGVGLRANPCCHCGDQSLLVLHQTRAPASLAKPGPMTGRWRRRPRATNLITAWEDKVDDILGSANADPDKARQMLEMFPQLPADGQEEVARHLSNLVPDQDYGLMRAYLTNASLPEAVLDVLLGDVLNRPNSLKLPALLDVARTPQHPKAGGSQRLPGTLPRRGLRQRLGQMAGEDG